MGEALSELFSQLREIQVFSNEMAVTGNTRGVLLMTLLEDLIGKGIVSKETIEDKFNKNRQRALDGAGDPRIGSLADLLGEDDDATPEGVEVRGGSE